VLKKIIIIIKLIKSVSKIYIEIIKMYIKTLQK